MWDANGSPVDVHESRERVEVHPPEDLEERLVVLVEKYAICAFEIYLGFGTFSTLDFLHKELKDCLWERRMQGKVPE
jgi:hypothetical protein